MIKTRLRYLAEINPPTPEFDRLSADDLVTFTPLETIWADTRLDLTRTRPKAEVSTGYTRFLPGDVLVPKVTPTFQAGRSAIAGPLVNGVGAGTTELHVLRPHDGVDRRYLRYVVLSEPFLSEGVSAFQGVAGLQRVPDQFIRDFPVAAPDLDEQRRIADFLDAETSRLDAISRLRGQQLTALDQASASRILAAIRGAEHLGPRVPTRSAWLGDVPDAWPVLPTSYEFEVDLGKMLNDERTRGAHLKPYLRNANVQWNRVNTDDLAFMDFPPHERRRYGLRPGDLLICEGGEPGRSAIWDGSITEIYYQKAIHRARSRGRSLPRWLFYCMRAATYMNVFAAEGNTTTIAHLTGEQIRALRLPFPDPEVQLAAVAMLDESEAAASALRGKIHDQIDLLVKRKHALITAAVTGQIDVTTAQGVADREL